MSVPVLFLDIDGVLLAGRHWRNGHQDLYPGHAMYTVPPEMGHPMNELFHRAPYQIVVSSTWRYDEQCRDHLRAAGIIAPFHSDWRTGRPGYVFAGSSLLSGNTRGSEIADWLVRHPKVTSYAIVDDDGDMLNEQRRFFVQTNFEEGLTMAHVDRLADLLRQREGGR